MQWTYFLWFFYLMAIMIITGIAKEHNLFASVYQLLINRVKSKKLLLFLISTFTGILPVPGRIIISTPFFDTISTDDKESRSRLGLMNYLATHHYYLWSPLEQTIIIPMAMLGLGYLTILGYLWPILLVMILFSLWYMFFQIKDSDINFGKLDITEKQSFWKYVFPLFVCIGSLIAQFPPYISFTILAIYYICMTKTFSWKKINSYINWRMLLLLIIFLSFGEYIQYKSKTIMNELDSITVKSEITFLLISCAAFFLSFIMGSSAKFAGIVSILTKLFGLKYFAYFMAIEFSGYLLSFSHKCVIICSEHFKVRVRDFLAVIGLLCIFIMFVGIVTIHLFK